MTFATRHGALLELMFAGKHRDGDEAAALREAAERAFEVMLGLIGRGPVDGGAARRRPRARRHRAVRVAAGPGGARQRRDAPARPGRRAHRRGGRAAPRRPATAAGRRSALGAAALAQQQQAVGGDRRLVGDRAGPQELLELGAGHGALREADLLGLGRGLAVAGQAGGQEGDEVLGAEAGGDVEATELRELGGDEARLLAQLRAGDLLERRVGTVAQRALRELPGEAAERVAPLARRGGSARRRRA